MDYTPAPFSRTPLPEVTELDADAGAIQWRLAMNLYEDPAYAPTVPASLDVCNVE